MPATPWRPMRPTDLPQVEAIAELVHPRYPEDAMIPAERLALCPTGCLVLESAGNGMLESAGDGMLEGAGDGMPARVAGIAGYALSHPWLAGQPPKLNSLLHRLPAVPETWHVHDLALLPAARGRGAADVPVRHLLQLARQAGLPSLSLVAVNGSAGFWQRHGFVSPATAPNLRSYGTEARFMVHRLPPG